MCLWPFSGLEARLEKMDKDHEALQEAASFQAKREAAIQADEEATEKKRRLDGPKSSEKRGKPLISERF